MRKGFTLIEVIVALLLFQFGMLALAVVSVAAARDLGAARKGIRAQSLARNRVELLRAGVCPPPASGRLAFADGTTESWVVEAAASRRVISDSVAFSLPGGRRGHVVWRASTICPP